MCLTAQTAKQGPLLPAARETSELTSLSYCAEKLYWPQQHSGVLSAHEPRNQQGSAGLCPSLCNNTYLYLFITAYLESLNSAQRAEQQ